MNSDNNKKATVAVLLAAALIFAAAVLAFAPEKEESAKAAEYAEYEKGVIRMVLADSTEPDESSDGAFRGDQLLIVDVTSGQYEGEALQVYNFVGPLYGVPLKEGDGVTLIISTYSDGTHTATVYEYNRIPALLGAVIVFLLATALVGGKTGIKSLVSLAVTVACLFFVLIPALIKGAPTVLTVFLCCAFIAFVSFTITGGISKKTLCAALGAIAGTAFALIFAALAQSIAKIDGMRISEVEPLLQLRQQGTPIGLTGLLTGGIIISALGAVMDVTMGIASSMAELGAANPDFRFKDLFSSGMNIGRDMVGTMTNTLILAFLGSGFTLIIYLYSLGLSKYQLLSSSYMAIEVISGLAGSTGVILSIPLTALIGARFFGKK